MFMLTDSNKILFTRNSTQMPTCAVLLPFSPAINKTKKNILQYCLTTTTTVYLFIFFSEDRCYKMVSISVVDFTRTMTKVNQQNKYKKTQNKQYQHNIYKYQPKKTKQNKVIFFNINQNMSLPLLALQPPTQTKDKRISRKPSNPLEHLQPLAVFRTCGWGFFAAVEQGPHCIPWICLRSLEDFLNNLKHNSYSIQGLLIRLKMTKNNLKPNQDTLTTGVCSHTPTQTLTCKSSAASWVGCKDSKGWVA